MKTLNRKQKFKRKIDEIKYKNVNPEDIKIIEPCCGSGHILVYVFDLLFKMYEEKGYNTREIPTLILKKNLTGLDVDKRAAQLASFSLIMKARSANSRFFNDTYYTVPEVYEIWDARALFHSDYLNQIRKMKLLDAKHIKDIEWLAETFRYGKTIGSLLKVDNKNLKSIQESIEKINKEAVITIFNTNFMNEGLKCLHHLLKQAQIMSTMYDVMITNPPYIGLSSLEKPVKEYANINYADSKNDMFAMFMRTEFVKKNGFTSMINMQSWMFLQSFEFLRNSLLSDSQIVNLIHLGAHAFDSIGGEVVQTVTFVLRKNVLGNGNYIRVTQEGSSEAKKNKTLDIIKNKKFILTNPDSFQSIPTKEILYWLDKPVS